MWGRLNTDNQETVNTNQTMTDRIGITLHTAQNVPCIIRNAHREILYFLCVLTLWHRKDSSSSWRTPPFLTLTPFALNFNFSAYVVLSNLLLHNKQFITFWRNWQTLKVYPRCCCTHSHDLSLRSLTPAGTTGIIEVSFVGQVPTFKILPDLKLSLLLRQLVYISSFYHCWQTIAHREPWPSCPAHQLSMEKGLVRSFFSV